MIAEFAVEPASIVTSYDRFDNVTSRFGCDRGRAISDFAGARDAWAQQVRNAAASLPPVARSRVADRLNGMKRNGAILRLRETYAGGPADWERNVVGDHQRQRWDGVVNNSGVCASLPACAADRISESPLFHDGGIFYTPRTASALATLSARLLSSSRQLDLVDPYLSVAPRFLEPLAALVASFAAARRDVGDVWLHADHQRGTNDADFERECRTRLQPRLPAGLHVIMARWGRTDDEMHERAIVTELGGYRIDSGLDVRAGATTSVSRIGQIEAARVRNRFRPGGAFPLLQRVELIGGRRD